MAYYYSAPPNISLNLTRGWLILSIVALAIAGLFSLPPVIFRGPLFASLFDTQYVFDTALIIHVNMSVLVWLLAMGGVMWSAASTQFHGKSGIFQWAALLLATVGTFTMTAGALVPDATPLKNNYIPTLINPVFFYGLALFGAGIGLQSFITVLGYSRKTIALETPTRIAGAIVPTTFFRVIGLWFGVGDETSCNRASQLRMGVYSSAWITLLALIAFFFTWHHFPDDVLSPKDGKEFYELLFWAGGHILQFTYTTLLMTSWIWLAGILGLRLPLGGKTIVTLFALNFLLVIPAPFASFWMDIGSSDYYEFYTDHMRIGLGVAPALLSIGILVGLVRRKRYDPKIPHDEVFPILGLVWFSLLLFATGGGLGILISGHNVTIPAHYHGSIIGITTCLMGLCFYLLPQLGFGAVRGKLANIQPFIYGGGQLMHITGLAWMGGYGALRKTAASTANIDLAPKLLFFTGGALAIVGGLLFVVLAVRALRGVRRP